MPILHEQLAKRAKGGMAENEDWWHLCYDTDTEKFYVEHSWSYLDRKSLRVDSGSSQEDAESFFGQGSEKIPEARARLLERVKTEA